MPRTARASAGGVCYHVMNRGNGRATVFFDPSDYAAFVELIGDACRRLPMRVLAFCLMPNTSTFRSGRTRTATWAGGCSGC